MSEFTLEKAYEAWSGPVEAYLREPTIEELAALTPELSDEEISNMNVGELQDLQRKLWKERQVRNLVGLLRKEAAFARRNEHHVLNGIFGKEVLEHLSVEAKEKLHARFKELNEAVKADF